MINGDLNQASSHYRSLHVVKKRFLVGRYLVVDITCGVPLDLASRISKAGYGDVE